jgi:hypothetical protein
MNTFQVRLNHQKLSFVQNFKTTKIDYLADLLNVQGLFGDAPECHNGEQFMSFLKSP